MATFFFVQTKFIPYIIYFAGDPSWIAGIFVRSAWAEGTTPPRGGRGYRGFAPKHAKVEKDSTVGNAC